MLAPFGEDVEELRGDDGRERVHGVVPSDAAAPQPIVGRDDGLVSRGDALRLAEREPRLRARAVVGCLVAHRVRQKSSWKSGSRLRT